MQLVGVCFIGVMTITSDGIVFYRVNKLNWSDIASAKSRDFLGINHIYLRKKNGMSWWLPLYLKGDCSVREALLSYVPKKNPLHQVSREI